MTSCVAESMSTLIEIETAIDQLSEAERESLESRILARRFGLDSLSFSERSDLLQSLEEADAEIDAGQVRTADPLRQAVRSWAR